ncbi:hypothetical protein V5E97_24685 [Singulisphaera sp. Ch08]|uniref:Uncharacterized protein n=1 Tax=Singulisphaera sp. Ch08 TaxID=3120278 RepID=A0AAU7C819_9BACT
MTLHDIYRLIGILFGLSAGSTIGRAYFDLGGWFACIILFALLGFMLGSLPEVWDEYRYSAEFDEIMKQPDITEISVEQLRTNLRDPRTYNPYEHLIELDRRGEDISIEFPFVLDMLCDESVDRRIQGCVSLTSLFPDLAKQVPDYHYDDTPDECRRKLEPLRIGGL